MKKQIETIPAAAMKTLTNWSGRETFGAENIVERAVILTRANRLSVDPRIAQSRVRSVEPNGQQTRFPHCERNDHESTRELRETHPKSM